MIAAIIQARFCSTRLPGKIMLKVFDQTLLEFLINRVKISKTIDKIIIATTTNPQDDVIEDFCKKRKIDFYRGNEDDVLERYFETAKKFSIDTIVRLTSDTPLLDPLIIDKVVTFYKTYNYDYVSNIFPLPRTYPDGFNVEIFPFKILKLMHVKAKRPSDREHVTNYVSMQPKIFKIGKINHHQDVSKFRLNLDYPEDFLLIKKIIEHFHYIKKFPSLDEIILFLIKHPEIVKINSQIKPYENILKSFDKDLELGFENRRKNYYIN